MTVIPLPSASRRGAEADGRLADWAEPCHFARSVSGLVHDATGPLLGALIEAIAAAADRGVNDTGARAIAEALRDARLALDTAITTAGRALADREVHLPPAC
jgi:hypothetical protein